jgi:DNA-binding FadR family transcriptional regulator
MFIGLTLQVLAFGRMSQPRSRLPDRRNLSHAIVEEILNQVREGSLRPGDAVLTERGLMQEYGVGRNTVRESIQALVALGIVETRPGRGARIRELSRSEGLDLVVVSALLDSDAYDDLTEFRLLLEPEIAACAASRATADELELLAALAERCRSTLGSDRHFYENDLAFHRVLAEASRNQLYLKMHDTVAGSVAVARQATIAVPGGAQLAALEHERIVDAVVSRDAERAREAMRQHIESTISALARAREAGFFGRRSDQSSAGPPLTASVE